MIEQQVQLPPYSMWTRTALYEATSPEEGSVLAFGLMRPVVVPDPSDSVYTVPAGQQGRLDLVSNTAYGTTELWWVIAAVNNLDDPLVGPSVNDKLRVPSRSRLAKEGVLNV